MSVMLGHRELTKSFRLNSLCHFGHINVSAGTIHTNLKATNFAYRLLSRKSLREDMARLRERSGGVAMPLSSKPGVRVVGHFNLSRSAALTVYTTKATSVVTWDAGDSKQYENASVCKVGVWTRWVYSSAERAML